MAHRIDKDGNVRFDATSVEDGKEFDRAKARDYGVPEFGRIEIPLNGRQQLRTYADELVELADRMKRISLDLNSDEVTVVIRAWAEIRHTSNRLRNRLGPRKSRDAG